MQRYAALVLSLCLGSVGAAQRTNHADSGHLDANWIPDPSCEIAASKRPGLSKEEFVRAVINQTVCRGRFITSEGVRGMTFTPVSDDDRAAVIALGQSSVPILAQVADSGGSFAQLIAVRLLADVGGPDAASPLERALGRNVWQPTRMAALYGISKQHPAIANPILLRMKLDPDPKIAEIATSLLKDAQP
jgi:hypothetical protein